MAVVGAVVGVGSFDGERQDNTRRPGGRAIHREDAADERSLALVESGFSARFPET